MDDAERLYLKHKDMIMRCAVRLTNTYRCPRLLDDLVSAGTVSFLEHLGDYDAASGASLSTYLYPHILGAMKRELEKNIAAVNLSKREFEEICEAGLLSSVQGVSLNSSPEDDEGGGSVRLFSPETPVHRQVYLKICIEYVWEEFENNLSFKERELLGGFFGAFGYEEETLAGLGEQFNMKENAAMKAKNRALQKMTGLCLDGKLGVWRDVYHAVIKSAMEG